MMVSIGFQNRYQPNIAWQYSRSLFWPRFPARAVYHHWLWKAYSWFTSVLAKQNWISPCICKFFSSGLYSSLRWSCQRHQFACTEDPLSTYLCSSFKSSANSGRGSDGCSFFCTVCGLGQPFLHKSLKRSAMKLVLNIGSLGGWIFIYLWDVLKWTSWRQ